MLTCFVAVTSAPTGDMVVSHGSSMASHPHSIGWCACDPEPVTVTAPEGASGPAQGVRLYGVDARVLGGPQGWGLARARPEAVTGGGDAVPRERPRELSDRRSPFSLGRPSMRGGSKRSGRASFGGRLQTGLRLIAREDVRGRRADAGQLHARTASRRPELTRSTVVLEDAGGAVLARGGARSLWCDLHGRSPHRSNERQRRGACRCRTRGPDRRPARHARVGCACPRPGSDYLRERGRPYGRRHGVSHGERPPRRRPRPAGNAKCASWVYRFGRRRASFATLLPPGHSSYAPRRSNRASSSRFARRLEHNRGSPPRERLLDWLEARHPSGWRRSTMRRLDKDALQGGREPATRARAKAHERSASRSRCVYGRQRAVDGAHCGFRARTRRHRRSGLK